MIYFFLSRLLVAYTNDGHLKALQVIEFCPTTSYQINILKSHKVKWAESSAK